MEKIQIYRNDFKEDLINLIDFYKEEGYRDARILSDYTNKKSRNLKYVSLNLDIEEGNKYYFGDINFIGNTVYSTVFSTSFRA